MADYIERERARHECKHFFKGDEKAQEDCESLLCDLPAADVAPVRRGQWKPAGFTFMGECVDCSECGYRIAASIGQNWNYCPNCGAKMEWVDA